MTRRYAWAGASATNPGESIEFTLPGVFLDAGGGNLIELFPAPGPISDPGFPLNHFALRVDCVEFAYKRALGAGARTHAFQLEEGSWDGAPLEIHMEGNPPATSTIAFVRGPDGELIEFFESEDF